MEISIVEIAVGMLILMSGMEILINLLNRFTNHETKISPSYLRVIIPIINAYVTYGLITTASVGAVTNYVMIYGIFVVLIIFVIFIAVVLALLPGRTTTKY